MGIPHRCPVCEGRGEVGKRLAQVGSVVVSQKPLRYRCHSCHGTGVIWDNTFTLQTPNLPFIQTWNNPKIGPDGSPVVPLTLGDGVAPLTVSSFTAFSDGVAKCGSCKKPIFGPIGSGCQLPLSHVQTMNGE